MSGSGRKNLPEVRVCPGVVERPFRMSGRVRVWSGGIPEFPEVSGSGREALQDVQEWLGGPPECSGVFGRPSRMS